MYLLPCMAESRFAESIPIKYTTNASGFQLSLWALIVIASNAPVYTRHSLLGADGPQAPSASAQLRSMHKPPVASADLSILGRDGTPGGPPLGERTTAAGSTTARLRVVSKCALREGRQRERSAQAKPRRSRFGSRLLVDHRPSGLQHSATNEPPANVYLSGEITLYTIHPKKQYYKTISSVPAPMRTQPTRDLTVNFSWRKTKASTSVMTTLSLSTGTTLEASPIWSAL